MRPSHIIAAVLLSLAPAALDARGGTVRVPQDWPTIQQGVDNAIDGDVIKIQAGTYNETVTLTSRNDLTLQGMGKVIIDAGASGAPLTLNICTGVTVKNLRLQNTTINHGLQIGASIDIRVIRCSVRNVGVHGIFLSLNRGVRIENCTVKNAALDGIHILSDDCVVRNNRIHDSGWEGIQVFGERNSVLGNRVENSGTFGILLSDFGTPCTNTLIQGNDIRTTMVVALQFSSMADGCTVIGNSIRDGGTDGINVGSLSTGNVVRQNRISRAGNIALAVSGTGNLISANQVKKSGSHGISVSGDDNLVTTNRSTRNSWNGMNVLSCEGNLFTDNRSSRNGQYDLRDTTSDGDNTYAGNRFDTIAP